MSHRRSIAISQPSLDDEEWNALREPLQSGWLTSGPKVQAFERDFAARHGARYALAASSCTTALHLILAGMGIGPGDEVIVPSFTWVATANAVLYCGATPVLVDVDPTTYNITPAAVAARRTEHTRAVIAVHLFGLCADMDALAAAGEGVPIIEDAACAAGAAYRGRPAGSLGLAAAFSFHPRKSITTGEGGMVTTNDGALAETIGMLRNHGASVSEEQRHRGPRPYLLPDFNLLGYNYRMTDLQAAVGIVQLQKLDRFLLERRRWAAFYDRALADVPWLRTPVVPPGLDHSYQAYVCRVDPERATCTRNVIMERLQVAGISTRPGTHAVHMLGYHARRLGYSPDDLPAARDCERDTLALPLHNRMSSDDYHYVVDVLRAQ